MRKNHQCNRCKRHFSEVFEVAKATGSRRQYCEQCIETMRNKGAKIEIGPASRERHEERRRKATAAAVQHRTNKR